MSRNSAPRAPSTTRWSNDRLSASVAERKEELARTIALEAGKPIKTARVEADRAAFTFKVAAEALRRHPRVNASWRDGTIASSESIGVSLAVATDEGLVAPVIHDADALPLPALAARRRDLVAAARANRLRPDDVAGGTFTISNLGTYGVDSFDAIVNAPQAGILAVGRIRDLVVPVDGAPAVRPVLSLSVSFDHRVVDGARGAEFLDTLAALLEEPAGLVP